jgi:hypothetical protein
MDGKRSLMGNPNMKKIADLKKDAGVGDDNAEGGGSGLGGPNAELIKVGCDGSGLVMHHLALSHFVVLRPGLGWGLAMPCWTTFACVSGIPVC